ncbi:GGDEF domain-containing protein [Deinococcus sp. QL22]|uniref:GGDEF domain-containing protein n=1 Tax=Deinococcus sp. QL22 TaxID=2939437 RepID=UPI0020172BE4|nr:GGDEF domain-containing protein [Deinococcus sp. QL22]UQN05018.1 GGDEF domain-containing protein [Deinococcus sp. QL22]
MQILQDRVPSDWFGLLHLTASGAELLHQEASVAAQPYLETIHARFVALEAPAHRHVSTHNINFVEEYSSYEYASPAWLAIGVKRTAWLHLSHPAASQTFVLVMMRFEELGQWTPEERTLLEAAARSIEVVLERTGHVQTLERAALTDALTGLGNRRALDMAVDEATKSGQPYTVAIIDLDGMKCVNDTMGHASGDMLLREFAHQLYAPGITAYRLGGDEYALLHLTAAGDADGVLLRLVARASAHVREAGYPASASMGIAGVPHDAPDATSALRTADQRMYAQKRERQAKREVSAVSF